MAERFQQYNINKRSRYKLYYDKNNSDTPSEENDPSFTVELNYDNYGLYQQGGSITVIKIGEDIGVFERVGLIELRLTALSV
jgi:hypothetical protein